MLGCAAATERVHVWVEQAWARRIEFGVCREHAGRLDAGEERRYETDGRRNYVLLAGSGP